MIDTELVLKKLNMLQAKIENLEKSFNFKNDNPNYSLQEAAAMLEVNPTYFYRNKRYLLYGGYKNGAGRIQFPKPKFLWALRRANKNKK